MPNNSLYDGILMPQGGVYEPGPAVMLPPSAPAKQSAVVRALIASDPNGPGLRDPQSGMAGGWSQMQDFADSGSPAIPGPNGTMIAKDQTRLPGQVPAQFDPVEAYSGVPRNSGQQAIATFAPRSSAFSPWGPDWTSGVNAPGLLLNRSPVGAPRLTDTDPWADIRFGGEPFVQQPGLVMATPTSSPVAKALTATPQYPNSAGNGPVTGVKQGTTGYTIYNGDNGVKSNSGNWFNDVTGRG